MISAQRRTLTKTQTNMSIDKLGGALLQLPQEIRDEIYGHYFNRSYLVLWPLPDADGNKSTCITVDGRNYSREADEEHGSDKRDSADLALLRTCKSIHSDAKNFLYSKARSKATTFKYIIEHVSAAMYQAPPPREATDRMMNVEFELPVYHRSLSLLLDDLAQIRDPKKHNVRPDLNSRMQASCEATMNRFAGASIIRNSFRITLDVRFTIYNHSIGCLIGSPFFQALKGFVGFQTLTVVLQSSVLLEYARDSEARYTVRKIQKALKSHLGPSVERVVNNTTEDGYEATTTFHVEIDFEPRKFHVEKLRADATKSKKKAHGLRKEADRMIEEVHRLEV